MLFRKTLFIIDPTRKYLFDVNQNVTIKKLKRMIVAAADLNKVGLRIFHDGIEYTSLDDKALDELFPNLQLVEFTIQYSYDQVEDLEEIIDLKLLQYCNLHNGKYPYFYCFTCGKSICSDCLRTGEHDNHETKEKYDYLQGSRNLVEILFKDLNDMFKNAKGGNNDSIEELKAKVSFQYFPKLVEMVKQIEQKMLNLILFFLEKEKGNFKIIENNINLLKNHCQEGLDKLKKEIIIEDIIIDEDAFLTFHSKFKEIGNEKERFRDDIEKYKRFSDNFNIIKRIIEQTYKEIYNFLLKYLNITEFLDLKRQIETENIDVVDKEHIFQKLLSNVKKRSPSGVKYEPNTTIYPSTKEFKIEERKNPRVNFLLTSNQKEKGQNDLPSNMFFNASNNVGYLNNDINNKNNTTTYNYPENNNNNFASNTKAQEYTINNMSGPNQNSINQDRNYCIQNENANINVLKSSNPLQNTSNDNVNRFYNSNIINNDYTVNNFASSNLSNSKNKNNNVVQSNYYLRSRNINPVKESKEENENDIYEEIEEDEEGSKGSIYHVVCNIVPSKNQVILYNVDLDTTLRKNITFPKIIGITHFLEESAWVNHNNKLYILGGINDFSQSTKIFLEYDPVKESIKRLPDCKYNHSRHSLFAYDNQIFVVGGDRLECEKYDIINNEWKSLPNILFKQIYPVLYVHNDILYSFFGIDENIRKTDDAQKLNLKNSKSKWMRLNYKRNDCNLCVFGCGIAKIDDNSVLFLGGMDDTGVRNEAIKFDFSNLTAYKTNYVLEHNAYFKDSSLLKLSSKGYGNFSIDDKNPFLKIHVK